MSEDKSLAKDCLELALGMAIVTIALPFVMMELAIDKVKAYRDLLKQMESDL